MALTYCQRVWILLRLISLPLISLRASPSNFAAASASADSAANIAAVVSSEAFNVSLFRAQAMAATKGS